MVFVKIFCTISATFEKFFSQNLVILASITIFKFLELPFGEILNKICQKLAKGLQSSVCLSENWQFSVSVVMSRLHRAPRPSAGCQGPGWRLFRRTKT